MTIESILRQRVSADRILLVLSLDEFPDGKIPKRLDRLQSRGLEIMWVKGNIRSYKKLLPTRAAYPDAIIVTVDDDTIYPKWLLENLLQEHAATPEAIIGNRGLEVLIDDNGLLPYRQWPRATRRTPPHRVLLTGVGGILYPPDSLPEIILDDQLALRLCPSNDDLWFWAMALLKGTPVRSIRDEKIDFQPISTSQVISLHHQNLGRGLNDEQLQRVLSHFHLWGRVRAENQLREQ